MPASGIGSPYPVTSGGGLEPRWSRSGDELFYRLGDRIMAVPVIDGPEFSTGTHEELFLAEYDFTAFANWDVGPDGQFLFIKPARPFDREFRLVLGFFERLGDGQ